MQFLIRSGFDLSEKVSVGYRHGFHDSVTAENQQSVSVKYPVGGNLGKISVQRAQGCIDMLRDGCRVPASLGIRQQLSGDQIQIGFDPAQR